jgi:hypothetical protein
VQQRASKPLVNFAKSTVRITTVTSAGVTITRELSRHACSCSVMRQEHEAAFKNNSSNCLWLLSSSFQ